MEKKTSNRLLSIDILRGIAAFMVVAYHSAKPSMYSPDDSLFLYVLKSMIHYFSSFGYTGVYLFFVISGFCIHLKTSKDIVEGRFVVPSFVPFWKRRLKRLYPAYIVALIIYIALYIQNGKWSGGTFDILNIVSHLLMLHNLHPAMAYDFSSVLWTLAIEEQLYLAYFLFLKIRFKYGWLKTLIFAFCLRYFWLAICWIWFYVQNKHTFIPKPAMHEFPLAHWFTWILGALAVEALVKTSNVPRIFRNTYFLISIFILSMSHYTIIHTTNIISGGYFKLFLSSLSAPLWGIAFFSLIHFMSSNEYNFRLKNDTNPFQYYLLYIGKMSYSLYLTHEIVVTHIIGYLRLEYGLNPLLLWFSSCVLSLLLSFIFFHLVEKHFLPNSNIKQTPNI